MAFSSDSNTLLSLDSVKNLRDVRVAIISTEWNDSIVAEQIIGAQNILQKVDCFIDHYKVPGAFELPFACKQVASSSRRPDAVIAFGAVIRGGTPHFEYVCQAVVSGIAELNIQMDVPIIFGVLTLENEQQAWERLGGIHGHKGEEAAIAALKMIHFYRNL